LTGLELGASVVGAGLRGGAFAEYMALPAAAAGLAAEVLRLTGGAGADLVLESAGGDKYQVHVIGLNSGVTAGKRSRNWKAGPPSVSWSCYSDRPGHRSGGLPVGTTWASVGAFHRCRHD
jgi:hypothetical protein